MWPLSWLRWRRTLRGVERAAEEAQQDSALLHDLERGGFCFWRTRTALPDGRYAYYVSRDRPRGDVVPISFDEWCASHTPARMVRR